MSFHTAGTMNLQQYPQCENTRTVSISHTKLWLYSSFGANHIQSLTVEPCHHPSPAKYRLSLWPHCMQSGFTSWTDAREQYLEPSDTVWSRDSAVSLESGFAEDWKSAHWRPLTRDLIAAHGEQHTVLQLSTKYWTERTETMEYFVPQKRECNSAICIGWGKKTLYRVKLSGTENQTLCSHLHLGTEKNTLKR